MVLHIQLLKLSEEFALVHKVSPHSRAFRIKESLSGRGWKNLPFGRSWEHIYVFRSGWARMSMALENNTNSLFALQTRANKTAQRSWRLLKIWPPLTLLAVWYSHYLLASTSSSHPNISDGSSDLQPHWFTFWRLHSGSLSSFSSNILWCTASASHLPVQSSSHSKRKIYLYLFIYFFYLTDCIISFKQSSVALRVGQSTNPGFQHQCCFRPQCGIDSCALNLCLSHPHRWRRHLLVSATSHYSFTYFCTSRLFHISAYWHIMVTTCLPLHFHHRRHSHTPSMM